MAENSKTTTKKRKRGPGKPFKPGQSGNPGGRPKIIAEVRDLAREQTENAVNVLTGIMNDEEAPHAARVTAANSLLDRGWGKPAQSVAVTHSKSVTDMSDDELIEIIRGRSGNGVAGETPGEEELSSVH